MSNFGRRVEKTSVTQTHHIRGSGGGAPATGGYGGLGAKPQVARQFSVFFFWKKSFLMQLDHILHVFRAI